MALLHVSLNVMVVCDSCSVICFRFHFFDLGHHWGMLASCACLGGVAVLAHILKQAHYERQ